MTKQLINHQGDGWRATTLGGDTPALRKDYAGRVHAIITESPDGAAESGYFADMVVNGVAAPGCLPREFGQEDRIERAKAEADRIAQEAGGGHPEMDIGEACKRIEEGETLTANVKIPREAIEELIDDNWLGQFVGDVEYKYSTSGDITLYLRGEE